MPMKIASKLSRLLSFVLLSSTAALGAVSCTDAQSPQAEGHPLIGNPAPAFSLDSANGKGKVSLSGLAGKARFVSISRTHIKHNASIAQDFSAAG